MSTLKNKIIVGSMAAAILSGGAATAWAQTNDAPPAETSSSSSALPGFKGEHHHKGHGPDTAALAQKLGVSEDQLKQAFDAIRQDQGERLDPTALAQKLADKLGIDVSKVTTAMDELRTQHDQEENTTRRADLTKKLEDAINAGTLSSADRDSVLKAFDAGIFNFGHRDGNATGSSNRQSS